MYQQELVRKWAASAEECWEYALEFTLVIPRMLPGTRDGTLDHDPAGTPPAPP